MNHFPIMWHRCEDSMPILQMPDDPECSPAVIAYDPNREEGLICFDIMNAHFFRKNWKVRTYTHWQYAPAKPTL